MQKFKGRLWYLWWFNQPWKLITDKGDIDLWPFVHDFFISLNGQRADDKQEENSYTLMADENSEYQFEYIPGEIVSLSKVGDFGFTNVYAYLDRVLSWINGRLVDIEIEDGKQIKFSVDESEKVFGVYFQYEGNSCEVPPGKEEEICKRGQPDCCIFLSLGAEGFSCEKFGSTARILLDRLAKDTIRAKHIGSCELLGRKEL